MSARNPIVRCENEAARNALRMTLYQMGFCLKCLPPDRILTEWGNKPYVFAGGICQGGFDGPSENHEMMNSPAHMLAYIKHHNLAPIHG